MSKVTINYNGTELAEVTGQTSPVSISYNGSQIATVSDGETKTLACSGKYMSGNVGFSCESEITYLPVGGRIYYINSSATGATYRFFDSSYNEITGWSTISDLENAYYYSVEGTGSADKFYVADIANSNAIRIYDGTNYCMWATATEDLSSYSSSIEVLSSASSSTIGKGKTNTAWIAANRNNSTYYPAHNSVSGKVTCWDFCKSCNDASLNGCTDWFVPNIAEITQMRNSGVWGAYNTSAGITTWVNYTKYSSNAYSSLWSSSAYSGANYAWRWGADATDRYDFASYGTRANQSNFYLVCVSRAF